MFDIGFFELLLIGLVGLFVIGPERLPGAIKTGSLWFGRIKRNLLDTRRELEKHIGADEIRRELQNEQVMHNMAKLKDSRDELAKKIQNWQDGIDPDSGEVLDNDGDDHDDELHDGEHYEDEYHNEHFEDEDHHSEENALDDQSDTPDDQPQEPAEDHRKNDT